MEKSLPLEFTPFILSAGGLLLTASPHLYLDFCSLTKYQPRYETLPLPLTASTRAKLVL